MTVAKTIVSIAVAASVVQLLFNIAMKHNGTLIAEVSTVPVVVVTAAGGVVAVGSSRGTGSDGRISSSSIHSGGAADVEQITPA